MIKKLSKKWQVSLLLVFQPKISTPLLCVERWLCSEAKHQQHKL
jgi:hypothetical protein